MVNGSAMGASTPAAASATLAIEIRGIHKTYPKRNGAAVKAVDDLNLRVTSGQVFGFLGPNGAGKTTTIKMLCGLITPDDSRPDAISLNHYDVMRQRRQAMHQIGVVLEGTRNVYWRLSALENLLYFGRNKGYTGKALHQRAEQFLRELDLWDRRNDLVNEFSRGMQQKVAIACALIHDPAIVLLDEPTLGLDVQSARVVEAWVAKLAREQGRTVVLTTHQLDMAQRLCDRVAIMRKGKLVADHPVSELLGLFREEYFQIRVKGRIEDIADEGMAGWDDGKYEAERDETVFTLAVKDQEALHSAIEKVREKGWQLIAVARTEADLEEVFVKLTSES